MKRKRHKARRRFRSAVSPAIRYTIITVIALAMVTVVVATICGFLLQPEHRVKSKFSALATEYYEGYFFPRFSSSEKFPSAADLPQAMEKYEKNGFEKVTLRQILLYNNRKNSAEAPFLTKYCDEDQTYVKFYPEAPYSKTSYRAEYTYSCNF